MQIHVSNHSHMPNPGKPLTPEMAEKVIDGILAGKSQAVIAEEIGCALSTLGKWIQVNTEFGNAVRAARAEAAHLLMDETITIADTDPDPQRARNRIQARQRLAETRNRSAYGPSVDMNVTQRMDVGTVLLEARRRALPVSDQTPALITQDVEYVELIGNGTSDTESPVTKSTPNPFD